MSTMTLEKIRDALRHNDDVVCHANLRLVPSLDELADAIDAHLAAREAKPFDIAEALNKFIYEGCESRLGWADPKDYKHVVWFVTQFANGLPALYAAPVAKEAAYERAVVEAAMVTESVSIEGRNPKDIINDVISWHVNVAQEAATPVEQVVGDGVEITPHKWARVYGGDGRWKWECEECFRYGGFAEDIASKPSNHPGCNFKGTPRPAAASPAEKVDGGGSLRGHPLYELIRKSVAQGRVYGTQYDRYQWHAVIDQLAERIYKEHREASRISREEWEKAFEDGRAFHDTNPEAAYIADGDHLNCPSCGGSGHVDDALAAHPHTGCSAVPEELLADLRKFHEETEACDEFDLTSEATAALLSANLIEGTHFVLTAKGEALLASAPEVDRDAR